MAHLSSVEVVFTASQFDWLHAHLFQDEHEQTAYAFAAPAEGDGRLKLLVHHIIPIALEDNFIPDDVGLDFTPAPAECIARHTIDHRYSLIEIHSRPFAQRAVKCSTIDIDDIEKTHQRFACFANTTAHAFHHVILVLGSDSADGVIYDPAAKNTYSIDCVTILGHPLRRYVIKDKPPQNDTAYLARYSRQAQAFGERGQGQVKATRVGIVGLGGVGSAVAQQLALLGVRDFILVDEDTLEESNLNRFVGANWQDTSRRRRKTDIIENILIGLDPVYMNVAVHAACFPTVPSVDALKTCDVVFGCTDTHGSRLLLNNFAVQYMLPYIDIGVGIHTHPDGTLAEAGGQYRVVMPGGYCLECIRAINPVLAAEDLRSADQRALHQAHGYTPNEDIHAPSVAFLNSTLVSLAVGEFLNLLTAFRQPQRLVYYFLHDHSTRSIHASPRCDCVVCGSGGRLAMGDLEPVVGLPSPSSVDLLDLPVPTHGRLSKP